MKAFNSLVVLLLFYFIPKSFQVAQYVKPKQLKCTPNFDFVFENCTCSLTKVNRTTTGISFGIYFKKPISNHFVSFWKRKLSSCGVKLWNRLVGMLNLNVWLVYTDVRYSYEFFQVERLKMSLGRFILSRLWLQQKNLRLNFLEKKTYT